MKGRALLLGILLWAGPVLADPDTKAPPALSCMARYYAGEARLVDGRWSLGLPDGRSIPYDDGRKKTFEEQLASPDVKDVFAQRYRPGPIREVSVPDEDPGRIRLDPVFAATYGKTREAVAVVPVMFLDQRLMVNRKAAPAFSRVAVRLAALVKEDPALRPYLRKLGGTFVWRKIAGTDRQSAHSYGVSLDINVELSHYWRWQRPPTPLHWQSKIPQAIVDAFEAEGFIWGGRWYHYDTMHFEYRPELLDPSCYP